MDDDRAFKGRLSDQTAYPFAAIVVLALVGIIGLGLATGDEVEVAPAPSFASPASASSTERPKPNPPPGVRSASSIGPGLYTMTHNALRIRLTVPSGWKAENDAPAIYRTPAAYLRLHDVARVVTDVCAPGPAVEVGPSAADLVVALSKQVGVERVGPRDVTVGGHPTTRFVLYTQFPYCSDREGLLIFQDVGRPFGLAIFGIAAVTVYVVDVDGERLVITTYRSSLQSNEELDAIVESMNIDPIAH